MERDPKNTTDAPEEEGAASDDGGGFSRRFVEGILPDMMRKTASGALSTVMMTEEVVRTVLGAASRELLQYAREQVDKGKADIVALVSRELHEHLRDMDIADEMERILQRMDVEVSATVRFVPRGGGAGLAPDVKIETKLGMDDSAAAPGAASSAASKEGERSARKKAGKTSASARGSAAARKKRTRKSPAPKKGASARDAD